MGFTFTQIVHTMDYDVNMSIPKSPAEAQLLISNTIAEAVLSFQVEGDENQSEVDEIIIATQDFVEMMINSLQLKVSHINDKHGIVCTMDPINPSEFLFRD